MQETISITNFGGMITNPHKEDIPDNMAVFAYNLDPQTELGVLRGIEVKGDEYQANGNVNIPDVYESDWLKYTREDKSLSVNDATNANPIVIETTTAHNLVSGDKVVIASVGGNTAANGTRRITVTDSTHFSIPVAGNGAYTSGGTVTYTGGDKWDLVYADQDDNEITVIENFYDDETYRTFTDDVSGSITVTPKCVKAFNNQIEIGNGLDYNGEIVYRLLSNKRFFATDTVLAGVYREFGRCHNLGATTGGVSASSAAVGTATDGFFQANILYAWGVTFVYDGLQESNLYHNDYACNLTDGTSFETATLTITVTGADTDINNIDRRITGVNIYRAESSDTTKGNMGLFRLIDSLDIDSATWSGGGANYTYAYTDVGGYPEGGQTYEENTGIPETLTNTSVRYWINEVGGGYHWVTKADPQGLSNADYTEYIFRSKKFRPDMFDTTRDFLVLPELPTALAWYNDRLYAFSTNTVYRINPELMYIEDTYFGAGASHRQSVLVSEYGLYFCNLNGAYAIRDGGIETISDPIAESARGESFVTWKYFTGQADTSAFDRVVIKAEVDKRLVLFLGSVASPTNSSLALGYYLPTRQWYAFGLGSTALAADSGFYSGKDGEIYLSNATASYRLFAGATYEETQWYSKEFHLDEPSQNKSWNMVKWDATVGTGTVTVTYGVDGSSPSVSATSGSWVNVYKKTFQVKLVTTGNAVIDSIDIIVRRLFGKR